MIYLLVVQVGFEPTNPEGPILQTGGFNHSPTVSYIYHTYFLN